MSLPRSSGTGLGTRHQLGTKSPQEGPVARPSDNHVQQVEAQQLSSLTRNARERLPKRPALPAIERIPVTAGNACSFT
ncbi:hypothetical protein HaLaN_07779 [Haematococcus lacustris]|uniref:Uncharacterized protein n=1 Tax=Haematococcus lacustris TaxID=44745 RepID=A0A699YZF6_HAELA|nr:hypothetical protein HaLaN_07779 [Haematococcus lacustris]